jgi:acetyltransferase-like isoleucine patch superfamily enzyme
MFVDFNSRPTEDWIILGNGTQIHKTALVASWVRFDDNCLVHPYAIVGRVPDLSPSLARNPKQIKILKIGKNTILGYHSVIYSDVILGDDCLVGDFALIREGSRIGNICVIGCHVSISYDSKISDNCRFQNGSVFIGECGEGCFFGVGVVCSSDRKIDLDNYRFDKFTPPIFGKRVMIGSGANILPGVRIGDGAIIGAGSIVVKDVEEGDVILGNAAKKYIPHVQV